MRALSASIPLTGLAGPLLLGCSVYTEELLVSGSGGAGASASTGGGGASCVEPSSCPGEDGDCSARTCVEGQCGAEHAPAGQSCDEHGGKACDGEGSCVACLDKTDCPAGQSCTLAHECIDATLPNGASCTEPAPCKSGACTDGVCCESDCAGSCMACDLGEAPGSCRSIPDGADPDDECGEDSCNGEGACRCGDGKTNGDETDLDCGGPGCTPCETGKQCLGPTDCQSGVCQGTCQPPSCSDGVHNGDETDVDCGGACPLGCDPGEGCQQPSDCASEVCQAQKCQAPKCGDGVTNGSEACDDGNASSFDGCAPSCALPTDHLLLSEIVVAPTAQEFIEIYNPTDNAAALDHVYLADFVTYHLLAAGKATAGSTDFLIHFPLAATVAPHGFVVVSLESAAGFQAVFGKLPDFDLDPNDPGAPDMLGTFGATSGLTNGAEVVVLFEWDGTSDLVRDLDYLVYGDASNAVDKTAVKVGSSTYLPDTPVASQVPAATPADKKSLHRCDTVEVGEKKQGGNGATGHDETSESPKLTFQILAAPTPGGPPPPGPCP